jgi:hypothetical protein
MEQRHPDHAHHPFTRLHPLPLALLLLATMLACDIVGTSAGIQFDVRRELAVVRAGSTDPLPELTDAAFHSLATGSRVTTDANGEALLQGTVGGQTCRVFLFQDSGLVKKACPNSSSKSGNTTCVEEGSAVFSQCSSHIVMTPTGEARLEGTWVAVTYLPQFQATIYEVYEGRVRAWPVLDYATRTLGNPVDVKGGYFWYSMPDAARKLVPGIPWREPVPFEQMPPLVEAWRLRPWLERIRARAEAGRIPFPGFLLEGSRVPATEVPAVTVPERVIVTRVPERIVPAAPGLLITGGGGPLEQTTVQEALLQGLPWAAISAKLLPDPQAPVTIALAGRQVDARTLVEDRERARQLLARVAPDGFALTMLYTADERAVQMARQMAEYLINLGIKAVLEEVPVADAQYKLTTLIAAGEPVLLIQPQ